MNNRPDAWQKHSAANVAASDEKVTKDQLEKDVRRLLIESIVRLNKLLESPDPETRKEAGEALLLIEIPFDVNFTIPGPFSGAVTDDLN